VAVDGFGNLLIADTGNSRVRKVDTNGFITTVAGTLLNSPSRAIPDAFGNFYIADSVNSQVLRVDSSGIISTVAGKHYQGGYSGDGGVATNALLNGPMDLALDANGNLLIADSGNNRIRKVGLAGSPVLQLNGITTNGAGNYQVIITSPSGSVTSSIVPLTVYSITVQPTNSKAANGNSASFNVGVSDATIFSYQWFVSSTRRATAVPYISAGGSVPRAPMTDEGEGYTSVPTVKFVGGSGIGAAGTAVVFGGSVIGITMVSQGSGYTNAPPTIQIDAPSPTINTPLAGQTNTLLTLPSVTGTDATNYFVVLTSNFGSITSATVALIVFLPPQNLTVQYSPTAIRIQLSGTPNYPYILQSATNLTPPIIWKSFITNSADGSGNCIFGDRIPNNGYIFYRGLVQ
jgi:hypothetical protein